MVLFNTERSENKNGMVQDFYPPTSTKALIIFTRNPELGKCKTRLAKSVGDEVALAVYQHLLEHTVQIASVIKADRYVYYSEQITINDCWDNAFFRKKLQNGMDLGERMLNAFAELINMGYKKICIIGSDLLDLPAECVTQAYTKLDTHDVILGPSEDGGYYLLAMKNIYPKIFHNKAWGTDTVFSETIDDLGNCNVHLLQQLNDIDTLEDLINSPYYQSNKKLQNIIHHTL